MTAAGWPGVRRARRAAQWGKKKYAGSLAEDVWRRLDTMDFINRGMVFVFGGFVLNGDPTVKQFGIGLAVAVILDATVVRCLLVPARMVMLGKHSWYLPRWLGRILPRISIEGTEYFQARDQLPAASQAQDAASGPSPLVNTKDS